MWWSRPKTILFTGGGSAGHVIPNLAVIDKCQQEGCQVLYLGSYHGLERKLIGQRNIPYYKITTGKLRRYFSWRNFIDPLFIVIGFLQSFGYCFYLRPKVVFAKGGFVSFPVVMAAWALRIPVVLHESDLTPGLANKLCQPFAAKICLSFAETKKYLTNKAKAVVTGTPIRQSLLHGDAARGRKFCQANSDEKVLLIFGGSLGAQRINDLIRTVLPQLLAKYIVVHICGKGKIDHKINRPNYHQYDFIHDELADVLAAVDLVISRAGANAVFELLTLQKPNILIPLSRRASRGDQLVNAEYCQRYGFSQVLLEEQLAADSLLAAVELVEHNRETMLKNLADFKMPHGIEQIYAILSPYC